MQQLHVLTEERKILLLITDGQPDALISIINAVKAALTQGIEVLGIGIKTYSIETFLSPDACRVIKDLPELAPAMFSMLQNALLYKKQGSTK
jgi:nitric oxide reductase activation protein